MSIVFMTCQINKTDNMGLVLPRIPINLGLVKVDTWIKYISWCNSDFETRIGGS